MPATSARPITGPAYPSWVREVAADETTTGLNVAALRARTADASALAPADVLLELADGTRVALPHVRVEAKGTAFRLVVRLPRRMPAEVGEAVTRALMAVLAAE